MSLKYLDSLDLFKILGSFLAIPVSFGWIHPYLGMVRATRTRVFLLIIYITRLHLIQMLIPYLIRSRSVFFC